MHLALVISCAQGLIPLTRTVHPKSKVVYNDTASEGKTPWVGRAAKMPGRIYTGTLVPHGKR
jgi:hypothetical protein